MKNLLDAIIDGQLDAKEIAQRAADLGEDLGKKLTTFMRALVAGVRMRRISVQQAERQFAEYYKALSLAGFVEVAQDIRDHGQASSKRVIEQAAKTDVTKVPAIRKVDVMAREVERKNAGQTEKPSP